MHAKIRSNATTAPLLFLLPSLCTRPVSSSGCFWTPQEEILDFRSIYLLPRSSAAVEFYAVI
jgi:hypothetical protein